MALFLASMITREVLRAAIAGFDRRGITLYPFGAATPYRLDEMGTCRMIASVLAALLFNLVLGGVLVLGADRIGTGSEWSEFARAFLASLGWLNLAAGVINLIPGVPFDGGRVLTNALFWFSGQREQGLAFTRLVGEIMSLGLVLVGAWIGLTSQNWTIALVLVVIGWGAREAEEKGKQLSILHTGLSQLKARDVMEETVPQDQVSADESIAQMVMSHRYYANDKPLPVMEDGKMVGVVTLSKTDELLQGTWPTTSARTLAADPEELQSFASDTPLAEVVETIERQGSGAEELPDIPVIDQGMLVGSIDPGRLVAFEQAEAQLDAAEAGLPDAGKLGFFARLRGIVPAVAVLAALAILGNIAIRSDPYSTINTRQASSDAPITFTETVPLPDALVPEGPFSIRVATVSTQPVTTASLTLDGAVLPVTISGPDLRRAVIESQAQASGTGAHNLTLVVADRLGRLTRVAWQFWVGAVGTPTPAPGVETLQIVEHQPVPGGLVLAGNPTQIGLVVSWGQPVAEARLLLDGNEVPMNVEPLPDPEGTRYAADRYYLSAQTPALDAGSHVARIDIKGESAGMYSTDWTFSAAVPDDQNIYFKETGHFVSRDFYDYWNLNGGLDIFGYPISDRIREVEPGTGEAYIAQYFERARFELHPSLGNKVLLGSLGKMVHNPDPPAAALKDARFFPETGHNLSAQFLQFWQTRGGLSVFGYPISEAITETNPQDGKQYLVQYFERARFELHPELAGTPYEVQLGQLGKQIYAK
jgi:predicted transcriptional regulator